MVMFTPNDISELRKALGLSVVELAAKLHVNRTTVYHWESGHCHPTYAKLIELNMLAKRVGYVPEAMAAFAAKVG